MPPRLNYVRLVGGGVLIVAGLVLLVLWAKYALWLQGLPDLLDLCQLAIASAVFAVGVWLASIPVRRWTGLVVSSIAVSWKRDLVLSLVVAAIVVALLGPGLYYLGIDNPATLRLERLQEPGAAIATSIYRRLGRSSLHLAVGCGFVVLIAIWTCAMFTLISVVRAMRV